MHRQIDRQSDYCGDPFRFWGMFPSNLSSRIGPIALENYRYYFEMEQRMFSSTSQVVFYCATSVTRPINLQAPPAPLFLFRLCWKAINLLSSRRYLRRFCCWLARLSSLLSWLSDSDEAAGSGASSLQWNRRIWRRVKGNCHWLYIHKEYSKYTNEQDLINNSFLVFVFKSIRS